MYAISGNSSVGYVRRWVKLIPLESPKIGSWKKKTFLSSDFRILKNILLIREATVSKFKFSIPFKVF